MSGYRCVLVPIDFADCSDQVVRHAARLLAPDGARLILLHAFQLPVGLGPDATMRGADGTLRPVLDHLRAEAEARMVPLVRVAEESGAEVTVRLLRGPPAPCSLEEAERLPADLIVVGTHGRTGLRRLVLGSVAEEILRHALVPVLTVRGRHLPSCAASSCPTCQSQGLLSSLQAEAELDG